MKKKMEEREKFNIEEARKNVSELLSDEFRTVLVITDTGMVYNGPAHSFLASLSMIVNKAINEMGLPKKLVERAVELGLEFKSDNEEVTEQSVNEKMIEILELLKKQLTK